MRHFDVKNIYMKKYSELQGQASRARKIPFVGRIWPADRRLPTLDIQELSLFEPIVIDKYIPSQRRERYVFITKLRKYGLHVPNVVMLCQQYKGYVGYVYYVWKETEDGDLTMR